MKKKMVFFDIDGTLLDHQKKLPRSTKQAIADIKKAGHEVAIATGRAPFMFEELRKELEIDSYVSLNGQYVISNGEVVYRNPISQPLLHALTEYASAHDHPLVYMDPHTMKMNMAQHVYVDTSIGSLKLPLPEHDPGYYLNREIDQAMIFCTKEDEEPYRQTFPDLKFVRWHPVCMDIMPPNGSKARGIEQMIRKLGYDKEEVIAFGDHLNDIEMLELVGHGVAMGNALDIVKKSAKYVTKNVNEDGILHGLRLVGLL